MEEDRGGIQCTVLIPTPEADRPVAVLRLGGDHSFPVYRLFDHPQVPEGLWPHCNLNDKEKIFIQYVEYAKASKWIKFSCNEYI